MGVIVDHQPDWPPQSVLPSRAPEAHCDSPSLCRSHSSLPTFGNAHVSALHVSAFLEFGSFWVTQREGIFVSPTGASLQPKMSDGFLPGSLVPGSHVQTVFTLSHQ